MAYIRDRETLKSLYEALNGEEEEKRENARHILSSLHNITQEEADNLIKSYNEIGSVPRVDTEAMLEDVLNKTYEYISVCMKAANTYEVKEGDNGYTISILNQAAKNAKRIAKQLREVMSDGR